MTPGSSLVHFSLLFSPPLLVFETLTHYDENLLNGVTELTALECVVSVGTVFICFVLVQSG